MDFGQPNVEIGQKMANGQLLFLALQMSPKFVKSMKIHCREKTVCMLLTHKNYYQNVFPIIAKYNHNYQIQSQLPNTITITKYNHNHQIQLQLQLPGEQFLIRVVLLTCYGMP